MTSGFLKSLLPFVAALSLAGCVSNTPVGVTQRLSPQTHEAVLSYNFMTCSAKISGAEQARIRGFLDPLGLTAQDTLVVSVPKNRLPRRDAERRRTLNQIFAAYPAKVHFVQGSDLRILPQSEPQGIIRVVRTHAVGVACTSGPDAGCTAAQNLAAMIAEPSDTFLPGKGSAYVPPTGNTPPAATGTAQ